MQLNVSGLLKELAGATREEKVDGFIVAPSDVSGVDLVWNRSSGIVVSGTVTMMRTDAGIWVQARVVCEVICNCSRCLAPHSQETQFLIDEEFFPAGGAQALDDPDETQFISPDNVLDLVPTLQQYTSLGIPMSPLCSRGCAGICQQCGADLNTESCHCSDGQADPRWAALAGYATQRDGKLAD